MNVLSTLRDFFSRPPFAPRHSVLVAFSGGTDSTALLAGLAALRAEGCPVIEHLFAAHLDHGSDADSGARAGQARELAARFGVPISIERRDIAGHRRSGESWETAARRVRYEFLEEARLALGADWIVLAHHRDDQAETVLLRWLLGTGLAGLGAMRPIHGTKLRPLLALAKSDLAGFVRERGLEPAEDPGNHDLKPLRNRIRHRLLPALAGPEGCSDLSIRLSRLAERAAGASAAISLRLAEIFPGLAEAEPFLDRNALLELPSELWPQALAALSRASGWPLPPSRGAAAELARQLAEPGRKKRAGAALGSAARLRADADRVSIEPLQPAGSRDPAEISGFTYTFSAPGRIEVPEAGALEPAALDRPPGPRESPDPERRYSEGTRAPTARQVR